jgi:hypothetical protein
MAGQATRRAVQYGLMPFTEFSSVTRRTSLRALNLNWSERDLPERVRTKHVHRLHPYLGKFVPQLVEIFLRKYRPGRVCDPFCGSGTTLVEALALGIDSLGCDISEFNCLLSRVKTESYDLDLLEREVRDICGRAIGQWQSALLEDQATYDVNDYLAAWYAPQALSTLLLYRSLISQYTYQDVLKVVLSRAARSARLTTHFDLDFPKQPQKGRYYCYKHKRTCQPTTDAAQFIKRYSYDTIRRIREFAAIRGQAEAHVMCGDARYADFPACDMVLTSPPYVGLIDYHGQHRYAFELLGLRWQAEAEIGPASNGNSGTAKRDYVEDMVAAFQNVKNSLSANGRMVVVINDRFSLYPEIRERLGLRLEAQLERHVNRRTGRRADDFFESVLVWRGE